MPVLEMLRLSLLVTCKFVVASSPATPSFSVFHTRETLKSWEGLGMRLSLLHDYTICTLLNGVTHRKHSIEQEKQWDFLKELTAKISDVTADQEEEETSAPKRGR